MPEVTGLLVPPGDASALAAALARLVADAALAGAHGRGGPRARGGALRRSEGGGAYAGPAWDCRSIPRRHDRHCPYPPRADLGFRQGRSGAVRAGAGCASGVEILSTGGSARALREAGVSVKEVSEHSGFPEILDGRVKTLVPQIHGGILGRRDDAEHVAQMAAHGIAPIDLVAVNLYPFEATVARGAADDECIENIDIGGPALIRAAAKNHDFVTVLTEPDQYAAVLDELTPTWRHHACAAPSAGRRGICADGCLRCGDRRVVRREARRGLSPSASRSPARCARRCAMARTRIRRRRSTSPATGPASRPPCRCRARNSPTTT